MVHGWAFGSKSSFKLGGKKITLAVSAGIDQEDYQPDGKYKYTMDQLLAPFELTFDYIKANYRPPFILYGLEFHGTTDRIEKSAGGYPKFLEAL